VQSLPLYTFVKKKSLEGDQARKLQPRVFTLQYRPRQKFKYRHRYVYIVQQLEHAGHAMNTLFVDDLDALVAQITGLGLDPAKRETYPNGVAQDHVPRCRRKRDRVRRRSTLTTFWSRRR
jgi:hypothetical protein